MVWANGLGTTWVQGLLFWERVRRHHAARLAVKKSMCRMPNYASGYADERFMAMHAEKHMSGEQSRGAKVDV